MLLAGLRVLLAPCIAVSTLLASTWLLDVKFTEPYVALAIISALLSWILLSRQQPQKNIPYTSGRALVSQIVLAWMGVAACLLLIGYATKTSGMFSRRALFLWFVATAPIMIAASLALRQWFRLVLMSSSNARSAVIVGVNKMSVALARVIDARPELGFKVCCFFADEDRAHTADEVGLSIAGGLQSVGSYVNQHRIDVVFMALPVEQTQTQAVLADLRDTTSSVYLIPDISILDLIQARSDDIDGIPVIALCESPFQGVRGVVKRASDIAFASLLLLSAAPVMLLICAAIRLTSGGQVFFKQDRYGLDGSRIVVYKFRTMTVCENGDHIVQASRNDPRITPVGRFLRRSSLDELPQLINVLQGRMSLVGPRPHAVAHNEQYRKLISGYMVRHKVPPGITGLAQINGCRGETVTLDDMRRRIHYDLEYLRQWCWLLDIKIMINTCILLFRDKRAY
jgi:putative colanic acid biosynthesis UDP-glucose lipid carrier transferase